MNDSVKQQKAFEKRLDEINDLKVTGGIYVGSCFEI